MKALAVLGVAAALLWRVPPQSFRSGVELVRMDVSVIRNGAPAAGLTAEDFAVVDNRVRRPVTSVSGEDLPLSVQLVLDTSGSVSGSHLASLVAASGGLIEALRPGDEAGLITFAGIVRTLVSTTHDLGQVRTSLAGMRGAGATPLRDAIQIGLAAPHRPTVRPMLLVFTDGADNVSWLAEEDVIDSARRTGTVIHIVREPNEDSRRSQLLERLAAVTGGRVWSASSQRDLTRLFTTALSDMRARYLLTFAPDEGAARGWHDVQVSVRGGGEVTARLGYFKP
jgi:VWFA-related protein